MNKLARKIKRILSIILACMMIASMIPASSTNSYASEISAETADEANASVTVDEENLFETVVEANTSVAEDEADLPVADEVSDEAEVAKERSDDSLSYEIEDVAESILIDEDTEVSEETLTAWEEDSPVNIRWDESKNGFIEFAFDEDGAKYFQYELYRDGTLIFTGNAPGLPAEAGYVYKYSFASLFDRSGVYSAAINYNGAKYLTDRWEYSYEGGKCPTATDFEWEWGGGKPAQISWKLNNDEDDINDYTFDVIFINGAKKHIVRRNMTVHKIVDGRAVVEIYDDPNDYFGTLDDENNKLTIGVSTVSLKNIEEKKKSDYVYSTEELGSTVEVYTGPVDGKFDINSETYTFTNYDASNTLYDFEYVFELFCNGNTVGKKTYKPSLGKLYNKITIPFYGYINTTGDYKFTVSVNTYDKYSGENITEKFGDINLGNISVPERALEIPSNLGYQNGRITWDAVEDALEYELRVKCTDSDGEAKECYLLNANDGMGFEYLDFYPKDVSISVRAISIDKREIAHSPFSEEVSCPVIVNWDEANAEATIYFCNDDVADNPRIGLLKYDEDGSTELFGRYFWPSEDEKENGIKLDLKRYITGQGEYEILVRAANVMYKSKMLVHTQAPEIVCEPVTDFAWVKDGSMPIGLEWNIPNSFGGNIEGYDYFITLTRFDDKNYKEFYIPGDDSSLVKSGNSVKYLFDEDAMNLFTENNRYTAVISVIPEGDLDKYGNSDQVKAIYDYGDTSSLVYGPEDIEFNISTGELKITSGDDKGARNNLNYVVKVFVDGKLSKDITIPVTNKGDIYSETISGIWGGVTYTVSVNATWTNGDETTGNRFLCSKNFTSKDPILVSWDKSDTGCLNINIRECTEGSYYETILKKVSDDKEEQIISIGSYISVAEYSDSSYKQYLVESGNYRIDIVVDGSTYSSDILEYTLPSKVCPAPKNLEWIKDSDGTPIGLQWDFGEYFTEDDYYYEVELISKYNQSSVRNSLYKDAIDYYTEMPINLEIVDGKFRYIFTSSASVFLVKNDTYTARVQAIPKEDISITAYSKPAVSEYVWGTVRKTPTGPQDVKFDIKTGIVSYTCGDTYSVDMNQQYHFRLEKDGELLKAFNSYATKKGTVQKFSFEGLLNETGDYQLIYWTSYDSHPVHTTSVVKLNYSYTRPEVVLGVPEGFRCEKEILKWKAVTNAQSYMVEVYYDGLVKPTQLPTVATSLDLSYYVNTKQNVKAAVYAISKNSTLYANSPASEIIACERTFFFEKDSYKAILGDIDNTTIVKLVDETGVACSGTTFKSSNSAVATVDSTGKIKAISEGVTTITATPKGYNSGLNIDVAVVKEIYSVGAANSAGTKLVAISPETNESSEDVVKILTSPADMKIKSVEYVAKGNRPDCVSVYPDPEDETNRIFLVRAIYLDTIENEEEVTITFTVEDETGKKLSFDKRYALYPVENIPSVDGYQGYSFALRDVVLGNIIPVGPSGEKGLPAGWNWIDENLSISKYNGNDTYQFGVEYYSPAYGMIYDEIPVTFATPDATGITKLPSTMLKERHDNFMINVSEASPFAVEEYRIVSSNENVLMVASDYSNHEVASFDIAAIGKGYATLTLYVGSVKIASKKITVVEGGMADDIQYSIYNASGDLVSPDEDGVYNFEITTDGTDYKLVTKACHMEDEETVLESFTTDIVSSDSGVAKITYGTKVTSDKKTNIKLVGAGYATLTITANDALKTKQKVLIHVKDKSEKAIVLDKTTVTINTAKKAESIYYNGQNIGNIFDAIYVKDGSERQLASVAFFDAAAFDSKCKLKDNSAMPLAYVSGIPQAVIAGGNEAHKINIRIASPDTFKAGKYVMGMAFAGVNPEDDNLVIYKFITFKKVSTKPTFKVSQLNVPDFLFTERGVDFTIDGKGIQCNDIIVDGLTKDDDYSYDASSGKLHIYKLGDNKQLKLTFMTDDYKDISTTVNVKTRVSKLKLSATTGTLYKSVSGAYLDLSVKNEAGINEDGALTVVNNSKFYIEKIKVEDAKYEGGFKYIYRLKLTEDAVPSATEKLTLKFECAHVTKDYNFAYTVKSAALSKAKLALGSKSLTMYSYPNQEAQVTTTLKLTGGCDASDLKNNITITEKVNSKLGASLNRTISVEYDNETGLVYVTKASNDIKPGTYNYIFKYQNSSMTKPISITLPVKVIGAGTTAKNSVSVKVTAKNNVDLFNRDETFVKFTPKFTNVPSKATYELVGIEGKHAAYFDLDKRISENSVPIKEGVNVLEKETYSINLVYNVYANGAVIRVTSPEVKIKFKTKKATVKLFAKVSNLFSMPGETKSIKLETFCGYNPVDIDRIELTNMSDVFESELTKDAESGNSIVTITYNSEGKTKKGVTYTLKYNVYIKGAAKDAKPISVSYKVTAY